jgi:hypothetical protein
MDKLSELLDDGEISSDYRSSRIGASDIGSPCLAYLELVFRGFPSDPHSKRLGRIFSLGHKLEDMIVQDLKKAGLSVYEKDPVTGKQYEWTNANNTVVFKADGLIQDEDEFYILEIKSMNDQKWNNFKKKGIFHSHHRYFAQLQTGMSLSGVSKSIIIGYNKNTSEYHHEEVQHQPLQSSFFLARAELAARGGTSRIAMDSSDWRCALCSKKRSCWNDDPVPRDKRTCAHTCFDDTQKEWVCSKGCQSQCQNWERFRPKDSQ